MSTPPIPKPINIRDINEYKASPIYTQPVAFPEPRLTIYEAAKENTTLRNLLAGDQTSLLNEVLGQRRLVASYDKTAKGLYAGSLLFDDIVIWECRHQHKKPEYNRRVQFDRDGHRVWVASATTCATRAKQQMARALSYPSVNMSTVVGTAGEYASALEDASSYEPRQDRLQVQINKGMDGLSGRDTHDYYELRIWNGEPRLLYCASVPHVGQGVIGFINLDDPTDETGKPDPSMFSSPSAYRMWLRVAALGFEHVWGDSFRRGTAGRRLEYKTENDVNPQIPARATKFFTPENATAKSTKLDQPARLDFDSSKETEVTKAGYWVRTNRSGRVRTYTVMYDENELDGDYLNRGEALEKMEEWKNNAQSVLNLEGDNL